MNIVYKLNNMSWILKTPYMKVTLKSKFDMFCLICHVNNSNKIIIPFIILESRITVRRSQDYLNTAEIYLPYLMFILYSTKLQIPGYLMNTFTSLSQLLLKILALELVLFQVILSHHHPISISIMRWLEVMSNHLRTS